MQKMNISFNRDNITDAQILVLAQVINSAKHGGFMSVKGFRAKTGNGEVQDAIYCKGISYENAVKKSLSMLEDIEKNKNMSVTVKRGTWQDSSGKESPTGRKSKDYPVFKVVTETYTYDNLVFQEALTSVRKSLENPAPVHTNYTKIGNGVYTDESGKVYVRDLRLVSKKVIVEGEKKESASSAKVAVQEAIKKNMPVSFYRMFSLDGDYESISLGGCEIAQEYGISAEVKIETDEMEETAAT
jgi:hypothetical protein